MMSSKPLWREPAGASTESVSVRSIESLNTPGPRRRFDAPSSSRWAPPSGRSVAFSIPEGFSGGRGGKCFSRAISSFSVWFSTRSPTKAAPTFSFCALNRSTSPSNRRTKPTSSVGVIRSSESLAPGDIPGLNQAFVNAPLPPGNLPRLRNIVTGADSRANHYHSELIRRRRVSKRLFPLVLAIAALSIVRVRARESAPVTNFGLLRPRIHPQRLAVRWVSSAAPHVLARRFLVDESRIYVRADQERRCPMLFDFDALLNGRADIERTACCSSLGLSH